MAASWTEFLRAPDPPDHAVQVYADLEELAESVAAYLAAGFEADEPAIVIATPGHWDRFAARLAEHGWDRGRIERHGLLFTVDAEQTLDALLVDGRPSAEAFERVVGGEIDRVAERFPGRRLRAFGEMVDLLCLRGSPEAAAELEDLWNWFGQRRRFSLLCGYGVDLFDPAAQASIMPSVCHAHSHVRPAADPERLQRAVDAALEDTLGSVDAGKVYLLIAERLRETRVPAAQLALMWVSEQTPKLAERILASARNHYYLQQPAA
jgi:hypothetical protein